MRDLARIGCVVIDLSEVGAGVPDLLVGYRGVNYLFEVKRPDKPIKYTPDQVRFNALYRGQHATIQSADEAIEIISGGLWRVHYADK